MKLSVSLPQRGTSRTLVQQQDEKNAIESCWLFESDRIEVVTPRSGGKGRVVHKTPWLTNRLNASGLSEFNSPFRELVFNNYWA